jgi:hypothetical protein
LCVSPKVAQVSARQFEAFASCMACRWSQHLLKHALLAADPASLFPHKPPAATRSEASAWARQQRAWGAAQRRPGAPAGIRVHLLQYVGRGAAARSNEWQGCSCARCRRLAFTPSFGSIL